MIVLYWIFRAFTWVVSRLPFPVIYFLADFLKIFLHYILRYRRKFALQNLQNSFPEKSQKELKKILSQYYRNLSNIIVEVIKLESVNPEELKNRYHFEGLEHLSEAFKNNRSVIVAIGHCGNWEWMGTVLGQLIPVKGFAIVKPLSDKHFNRYMELLRHRINNNSTIPFQHTFRVMIRNRQEFLSANVFAADQTPTRSEINYWAHFLGQDTPFYTGVEKLAKSLDFSVVFIDSYKTGRGMYRGDIKLITHEPKNTQEFEITETYIRMLEEAIRKRPDNWLWTHRRWKFDRQGPII